MKRVHLFLALLIISAASLITATAIGFTVFNQTNQTNPYSWMSQMWDAGNGNGHGMGGGMMGQTPNPTPASNTLLQTFGVTFIVLIAIAVLGVIGVSYYLVYPQIRSGPQAVKLEAAAAHQAPAADPYDSVAKTLTEDERKIVESLKAHDGKYLQKYIKAETGLSRLQTHRILARLSERGIVALEKTGNTNEVTLADWLRK
jgi:uncharacterized membrane protein